jgi:hypothetical protein
MDETITDAELDAILARANAASPAPWHVGHYRGVGEDYDLAGPVEPVMRGMVGSRADAEFIAAARTDIPRLVAEVQRLRQRVQELERSG